MAGELSVDVLNLAFGVLLTAVSWVYELPPVPAVLVLFALFGLLAATAGLGLWMLLDMADQPPPGRHAIKRRCLHVDSLCPNVGDSPHGRHRADRTGPARDLGRGLAGAHAGRGELRNEAV